MEPRDLDEYLDELALKIEETGGEFIENPAIFLIETETIGSLDASMRYHDGSRLEITMTVLAIDDYPEWTDDSFHYMDSDNRCIFRYDNAPHHHGLPNLPHHKHIGADERPMGHPRPSVTMVVREVLQELS